MQEQFPTTHYLGRSQYLTVSDDSPRLIIRGQQVEESMARDVVALFRRPRWKRALLSYRLYRDYRRAGLGRWPSIKMTWSMVTL